MNRLLMRTVIASVSLLTGALIAVSAADKKESAVSDKKLEKAVFGGGCFWCVEAVFEEVDGVTAAVSGYAGGKVDNPSYEAVCNGTTGHAEVVEISFDPSKVSFAKLLEIFLNTHDPTTLNRQGNDVGTQYRSVVFCQDDEQKKIATAYVQQVNEAKTFKNPVVTEIADNATFWKAEAYHQDYFARNPTKGYCQFVIRPKVEKFRKQYKQ